MKLDKKIYVKVEKPGGNDEPFLMAGNDIEAIGLEQGETVGIYKLIELKKLHVSKKLI